MFAWLSGIEKEQRTSSVSGYLWKMKKDKKMLLVPQWNKRWFSIEGKHLKWYKDQGDEHYSGSIDLALLIGVNKFEREGAFSFVIQYPERNFLLRSHSAQDMAKWIRALQFQSNLAKEINPKSEKIIRVEKKSGFLPSAPFTTKGQKPKCRTFEAELERTLCKLEDLERVVRGDEEKTLNHTNNSFPFHNNNNNENSQNNQRKPSLSSSHSDRRFSNSERIELNFIDDDDIDIRGRGGEGMGREMEGRGWKEEPPQPNRSRGEEGEGMRGEARKEKDLYEREKILRERNQRDRFTREREREESGRTSSGYSYHSRPGREEGMGGIGKNQERDRERENATRGTSNSLMLSIDKDRDRGSERERGYYSREFDSRGRRGEGDSDGLGSGRRGSDRQSVQTQYHSYADFERENEGNDRDEARRRPRDGKAVQRGAEGPIHVEEEISLNPNRRRESTHLPLSPTSTLPSRMTTPPSSRREGVGREERDRSIERARDERDRQHAPSLSFNRPSSSSREREKVTPREGEDAAEDQEDEFDVVIIDKTDNPRRKLSREEKVRHK